MSGVIKPLILGGIEDSIQNFFYELLWNWILRPFLDLIGIIQDAFGFLTGIKPITLENNQSVTFLEAMFGFTREEFNSSSGQTVTKYYYNFNTPVHKAFMYMMLVFVVILVLCMVTSYIKILMNRQDKEVAPSIDKMFFKCLQAFLLVLVMPIAVTCAIGLVGFIMSFIEEMITSTFSGGGDSITIPNAIFKSNLKKAVIDKVGNDNISFDISWTDFKKDYLKATGSLDYSNFNFFIALLSTCCTGVGLAMACITVTERLINIIVLYLVSPCICGTIPLDDGKRWENWKDIMTAKLVTVAGNIISVSVFLYMIQFFAGAILDNLPEGQKLTFTMQITFLFIAISGAFCSAKAGTLIASIVSANQGQQEGMGFLASSKLLSMGGALAGKALSAVAGITGIKSLKNALGNNSGGNQLANVSNNQGGTGASDGVGALTNEGLDSSQNYNQNRLGGVAGNVLRAKQGINNGIRSAGREVGNVGRKVLGAMSLPNVLATAGGIVAGLGISGINAIKDHKYGEKGSLKNNLHANRKAYEKNQDQIARNNARIDNLKNTGKSADDPSIQRLEDNNRMLELANDGLVKDNIAQVFNDPNNSGLSEQGKLDMLNDREKQTYQDMMANRQSQQNEPQPIPANQRLAMKVQEIKQARFQQKFDSERKAIAQLGGMSKGKTDKQKEALKRNFDRKKLSEAKAEEKEFQKSLKGLSPEKQQQMKDKRNKENREYEEFKKNKYKENFKGKGGSK